MFNIISLSLDCKDLWAVFKNVHVQNSPGLRTPRIGGDEGQALLWNNLCTL